MLHEPGVATLLLISTVVRNSMIDAPTLSFITLVLTIIVQIIMYASNRKYFEGKFGKQVEDHDKSIEDLKKSVRYKDTCNALFNGHEIRLSALENNKSNAILSHNGD